MELTGLVWRKSSLSSTNGGNCVELAAVPGGEAGAAVVAVRDSKDPAGAHLMFTRAQISAFRDDVRGGAYDLP